MTSPAKMTGTLPKRSVRRPEIGDSANIPNVWPLMTRPTAPRAWPCSVMWSGVIVMIRTITTWPATSATIATGTCGRRRTDASEAAVEPCVGSRWSSGESCRPAAYGSGRSSAKDRIAAAPTKTIGHEVRPGELRQADRHRERRRPGATRFGPMTAPTVAPQTTMPIADARRCVRVQVRGRVARQLVGGVAEADEDGPGEQQRRATADDRDGRRRARPTTPIA